MAVTRRRRGSLGARVSQGGEKIGRMRSSLLLGGVHEMISEELFCIKKGKLF